MPPPGPSRCSAGRSPVSAARASRSAPRCTGRWGPGPNDRGLSRKHLIEGCEGSLRRLGVDYIDLYQAHRYDVETPLEETLRAFDDLVRQGKVLYLGVSEWTAAQIADAVRIATDMGFDRIVSNQPQYSMLWRVIEAEVIPVSVKEGIGQIVWSPIAQGVLTGKYRPGEQPPEGSRAADDRTSSMVSRFLRDDVLNAVQQLAAAGRRGRAEHGATGGGLGAAEPERVVGHRRAPRGPEQVNDNAKASGVRLEPELLARIDAILDPVVERDPTKTQSPAARP